MMLQRKDFPPEVPADLVDRILENQKRRNRMPWWSWVFIVGFGIAAIATIVVAAVRKWPYWAPGVAMAFMGVMSAITAVLDRRNMHRALVDQGLMCPKCGGELFTDTLSRKRQDVERSALMGGRCPLCFESIA